MQYMILFLANIEGRKANEANVIVCATFQQDVANLRVVWKSINIARIKRAPLL